MHHKTWRQWIECDDRYDTPALRAVLTALNDCMASARCLKADLFSTVVVLDVDRKPIVIKRSNIATFWQGAQRAVRRSRAMHSWQNAKRLLAMGVKTFTPIAVIEERLGPLRGRSYLLCSYIPGISALTFFRTASFSDQRQMIKKIVRLVGKLASKKIWYRDWNLTNILVSEACPWLIDLDSMRYCKRPPQWIVRQAERRFLQNWQEISGLSQELATYCQGLFETEGLLRI